MAGGNRPNTSFGSFPQYLKDTHAKASATGSISGSYTFYEDTKKNSKRGGSNHLDFKTPILSSNASRQEEKANQDTFID